eukprot:SAG31_NODE_33462_length_343_cov_1.266393_1_plen_59_part_10
MCLLALLRHFALLDFAGQWIERRKPEFHVESSRVQDCATVLVKGIHLHIPYSLHVHKSR